MTAHPKNKSNYFETELGKYGEELDNSLGKNKSLNFLLDMHKKIDMIDNTAPYTTINEINLVFHKSKLLFSPAQFAYMQTNNNVFVENPTISNWIRFNIDNIEEELINLKDKNKREKKDTVSHTTTITQKIPRK
jgi:hypothetical protein